MGAHLPTFFLMVVFAGWLNRHQQALSIVLHSQNAGCRMKQRHRATGQTRVRAARDSFHAFQAS